MIAGYFEPDGRPYVRGRLFLPRLGVRGDVDFLIDTGAVSTVLHPGDGARLSCPFDELLLPVAFEGVGGVHTYYREGAVVTFNDSGSKLAFRIEVSIAKPGSSSDSLDSLLGRDVLNRMRMDYDFPQSRLEFVPS